MHLQNICRFIQYFGLLVVLLIQSNWVFAQSFTKIVDKIGQYRVEPVQATTVEQEKRLSPATTFATINIVPDSVRPSTNAHITITFDKYSDLTNRTFVLTVSPTIDLFLNNNALDSVARQIRLPIGGLTPNSYYTISLSLFLGCGGTEVGKTSYTTPSISLPKKKLLLVLDSQYKADAQIDTALSQYQRDALSGNASLTFEKIYIEPDSRTKNDLYRQIVKRFYDKSAPLEYIFFMGNNAIAPCVLESLDPVTNKVTFSSNSPSLSIYTKITAQDYPFDSTRSVFLNRKYNCSPKGIAHNIISGYIDQSYMNDISFGAVVPTRPEDGKEYVLRYLAKLHRYNTGQLVFSKRVLLADTFFNTSQLPDKLIKLNTRWTQVDTIVTNHVKSINYQGNDDVWRTDYLKKLMSNSYEIALYSGHGTATYHFFDVSNTDITQLSSLNCMMLDFTSCSVADVLVRNYLAGSYLNTGNTLLVNAYSTPILGFNDSDKSSSTMDQYFKPNEVFDQISRGAYISDAYRISYGINTVQFLLGDPLLRVEPTCKNRGECYTGPAPFVITAVENPSEDSLTIYPNPSKGSFYLRFPTSWYGIQTEILNTQGQSLYQHDWKRSEGNSAFYSLPLQAGIYLLRVNYEGEKRTYKLVIE